MYICSFSFFCWLILITEMQLKGTNPKASIDHIVDVPKNGLTAMIAATDSNGCVIRHVLTRSQVGVGEIAVKELFGNGNLSPSLYAYKHALLLQNNSNIHQSVRSLQSSPQHVKLYIQKNYNICRQVY